MLKQAASAKSYLDAPYRASGVPALVLELLVATAVDVLQHAQQRTPIVVACNAPRACGFVRYQTGTLERLLDPRIAQLDPIVGDQLLMKMSDVQVEIPVSIEPQNLLDHVQRTPAFARCASPPSINPS